MLKLSVLLVMAVFGDTRCALRFLGEKIFKKIAHTLRGVAQSVQIWLDIIPQVTVTSLPFGAIPFDNRQLLFQLAVLNIYDIAVCCLLFQGG